MKPTLAKHRTGAMTTHLCRVCGKEYDKAAFMRLHLLGAQFSDPPLVLRNCPCGGTMAPELHFENLAGDPELAVALFERAIKTVQRMLAAEQPYSAKIFNAASQHELSLLQPILAAAGIYMRGDQPLEMTPKLRWLIEETARRWKPGTKTPPTVKVPY